MYLVQLLDVNGTASPFASLEQDFSWKSIQSPPNSYQEYNHGYGTGGIGPIQQQLSPLD